MVMLEVRLLGTFEAKYQKKPINISSRPGGVRFHRKRFFLRLEVDRPASSRIVGK
jgi:hypothetical protein